MRFRGMISKFKKQWEQIPSLQDVRQKLLRSMLLVFSVLGLPALVAGTLEALSQGHPATGLLYLVLYAPVLFATLFPQLLSFRWQLRALMGALYILALSNLLIYGIGGAGIHVLLTMCVLTTLLQGGEAGMKGIALSIAALLTAGAAHTTGLVKVPAELIVLSSSPATWLTVLATFLMFSMVILATASLVQTSLQRSLRDLNEHQDKLQASERKYRLLAETTDDLILTLDLKERITYANSRAVDISGESRRELFRIPVVDLLLEEERPAVSGQLNRLKQGEVERALFEATLLDSRGEGIPIEINATRIKISGEVTGVLLIGRDITDRKRAERKLQAYSERLEDMVEERTRELQEAQEKVLRREKLAVLGQLAGGVAHELRNPLGVMSNAVYYLKSIHPASREVQEEYLEILENETNNAAKIISDLLNFSRGTNVEREAVDIEHVLEDTLDRTPPPPAVQVVRRFPEDIARAEVDPEHLRLVLNNLLNNAYEAIPEEGRVEIAVKQLDVEAVDSAGKLLPSVEERFLQLSVRDTGTGIREEHLEKIFEPLFTTKARGIGLGLAVTRRLVRANGGSIRVESIPKEGARFTLILPAVEH